MNKPLIKNSDICEILTLASILLFTSTSSLAEVNPTEKVYTQNGYPYQGLVDRSEQVTIFYTKGADKGAENISCRVEVSQNGQIWQGEERITSLKKFTLKPLRACIDREEAKKLLAKTF
tara:strand:- start:693 stop:1049 length:357 start_codon:yes stop_codon:yes gene_type:complete